jgi:hypothetical protein
VVVVGGWGVGGVSQSVDGGGMGCVCCSTCLLLLLRKKGSGGFAFFSRAVFGMGLVETPNNQSRSTGVPSTKTHKRDKKLFSSSPERGQSAAPLDREVFCGERRSVSDWLFAAKHCRVWRARRERLQRRVRARLVVSRRINRSSPLRYDETHVLKSSCSLGVVVHALNRLKSIENGAEGLGFQKKAWRHTTAVGRWASCFRPIRERRTPNNAPPSPKPCVFVACGERPAPPSPRCCCLLFVCLPLSLVLLLSVDRFFLFCLFVWAPFSDDVHLFVHACPHASSYPAKVIRACCS